MTSAPLTWPEEDPQSADHPALRRRSSLDSIPETHSAQLMSPGGSRFDSVWPSDEAAVPHSVVDEGRSFSMPAIDESADGDDEEDHDNDNSGVRVAAVCRAGCAFGGSRVGVVLCCCCRRRRLLLATRWWSWCPIWRATPECAPVQSALECSKVSCATLALLALLMASTPVSRLRTKVQKQHRRH